MCGISCIFQMAPKKEKNYLSANLRLMLDELGHRGPDSVSTYIDDSCALGISRLAIVDVNNRDNVFSNNDQSLYWVVNGEIFNYKELRESLIQRGYRLRSNCDSEVMGILFEEYGPAFVNMLNGQFAVIIYNKANEEIYLYRDPFGIIPLYYSIQNGVVYIASEIIGFKNIKEVQKSFNNIALDQLFTFWSTIGSTTFVEEIKAVKHAHFVN